MLTQNEKKWLEKRANYCARCRGHEGCPDFMKDRCAVNRFPHHIVKGLYSLAPDYRDTAEFEARVAEKMAGGEPFCPPPPSIDPVKCAWDIWGESYEKDFSEEDAIQFCRWCSLRAGRLAVEAEMEAEMKEVAQ